jgi:hypothetical protein
MQEQPHTSTMSLHEVHDQVQDQLDVICYKVHQENTELKVELAKAKATISHLS